MKTVLHHSFNKWDKSYLSQVTTSSKTELDICLVHPFPSCTCCTADPLTLGLECQNLPPCSCKSHTTTVAPRYPDNWFQDSPDIKIQRCSSPLFKWQRSMHNQPSTFSDSQHGLKTLSLICSWWNPWMGNPQIWRAGCLLKKIYISVDLHSLNPCCPRANCTPMLIKCPGPSDCEGLNHLLPLHIFVIALICLPTKGRGDRNKDLESKNHQCKHLLSWPTTFSDTCQGLPTCDGNESSRGHLGRPLVPSCKGIEGVN